MIPIAANQLPALPAGSSYAEAALLIVLGLLLIFFGRRFIKLLTFLGVGILVGAIGAIVGNYLYKIDGLYAGVVIGFLVGGFFALKLLSFAIGLAVGAAGFIVANALGASIILSILVGVILFFIGIALHSKILSLATAVVGGFLLYLGLGFVPLAFLTPIVNSVIAVIFGLLGFWYQLKRHGR
jgi:hypothetical protein